MARHGSGTPTDKQIKEYIDMYASIDRNMGPRRGGLCQRTSYEGNQELKKLVLFLAPLALVPAAASGSQLSGAESGAPQWHLIKEDRARMVFVDRNTIKPVVDGVAYGSTLTGFKYSDGKIAVADVEVRCATAERQWRYLNAVSIDKAWTKPRSRTFVRKPTKWFTPAGGNDGEGIVRIICDPDAPEHRATISAGPQERLAPFAKAR